MDLRCILLYLPCFSCLTATDHYVNPFFCLSPVLEVRQNCIKTEFHQIHFTENFPNLSGQLFSFGKIRVEQLCTAFAPKPFAKYSARNPASRNKTGFPPSKHQSNSKKLRVLSKSPSKTFSKNAVSIKI